MITKNIIKFIEDGFYYQMKNEINKLKGLRQAIRIEQETLNKKRMVWTESGVVGEFTIFKKYEYNHFELNDFLYQLGILPAIAIIESKTLSDKEILMMQSTQIPGTKYVKFSPKDNYLKNIKKENSSFQLNLKEKISIWKEAYINFNYLSNAWDVVRKRAILLEVFRGASQLQCKFGTISLLHTPVTYQAKDILEILGPERLINCAKVDMDKLADFTAKGFLAKSDINTFRKVTEVSIKYTLMTLEKEIARDNYWSLKLNKLSQLNQDANIFEA